MKNPKVLWAAALHAPIEVVKMLLAKGAGKGGAGKAAARELCDRAKDSDRDAQVFNLLEDAGYDIHKSYYGDCITEGD